MADYSEFPTTPTAWQEAALRDSWQEVHPLPTEDPVPPARRRVDTVALVAGLLTLVASGYVLSDGALWVPGLEPRWLLAGAALLVGVLMLAGSLRNGRHRDR